MALVVRRTALFLAIVLVLALLAAAAQAATRVPFRGAAPGTIVVKTGERRLYYVVEPGYALRFSVGVGKRGWSWKGRAFVEGKYVAPAWRAPPAMTRTGNYGPVIPGGSPRNPMGAAALTMRGGEYAIHGTNNPRSIGGRVSHGCIRMHNRDIRQLFSMVGIGTPVIVE
jgi:lipoprotein-anchoring transpeptidase ErfK/SrfK